MITVFVYVCFFIGVVEVFKFPFKVYSAVKNPEKYGGGLPGKRNNRKSGIFGRRTVRTDCDGRTGDRRTDGNSADRDSDNRSGDRNNNRMSDISDDCDINVADSEC